MVLCLGPYGGPRWGGLFFYERGTPVRAHQFEKPNKREKHLHGYLAHKKTNPPRTLPQAYAYGPSGVLGGWAVSYERGTPVGG